MDTAQDSNTKKERINSIPRDPLCGKILFLSDWVKTHEEAAQGKECLPCDISTIAPWYRDLLKKRGYKELSEKVNALAEGEPPTNLEIAEVLDEVRESVKDEDTKKELLTYDCMMQTYEEEN